MADWRFIGESKTKSCKFKIRNEIDYKILAHKFEMEEKCEFMDIALDEAFHIRQRKDENDGN